jgi:hypothetical protein
MDDEVFLSTILIIQLLFIIIQVESTKLKETIAVLTQGVEMHSYEENRRYLRQVIERVPRLVWLVDASFHIRFFNYRYF